MGHDNTVITVGIYTTVYTDVHYVTANTVIFNKCSRCGGRTVTITYGDIPNKMHTVMGNEITWWIDAGVPPYTTRKRTTKNNNNGTKTRQRQSNQPKKSNTNLGILGLSPSGSYSKDEIRAAWRKMVMKHHPDKGGSAKKFNTVNNAYNALK